MKVLVLSDSHSHMEFMLQCTETLRPDVVIHLGDYVRDGQQLHDFYPAAVFYQVPGNCDSYQCPPDLMATIVINLSGVRLMLTHGHRYHVKEGTSRLVSEARQMQVDAVLYGHTHRADCRQESGLWILNPGSAGYWGSSAGWLEIGNAEIHSCRIIRRTDLEDNT